MVLCQNYFIYHLYTYEDIGIQKYFLCPGSFDRKSIGGSHGSLRPELAILEKIFSLPKIIFFLIPLFMAKDVQELVCISFCNICTESGD